MISVYAWIVFFCSFLYGLSAVLCKYGLQHGVKLRQLSVRQILTFLVRNKIWIIGVLVSFSANIIILEIQSIIDVSVVYPILNFSYVFALILGCFLLNEVIRRNQLAGIIIVIIGTIIIIFIEEPATGGETNTARLLLVSTLSGITIGIIIYTVYKKKIENYETPFAFCTGISFANVETLLKANTNLIMDEIGYFTVFSIDSIVYFISLWPFYMLAVFTAVGWLCMQITYSHGNVSITVPLFAVLQSSLTMINGFIVYNEILTPQKIVGALTIIFGVTIIVLSNFHEKHLTTV